MRASIGAVTAALLWVLAFSTAGCGGQDLVVGGTSSIPTVTAVSTTPTPTCVNTGGACTFSSDCCSGNCNLFNQCV